MSHATAAVEVVARESARPRAASPTLMLIETESRLGARSVTLAVSLLIHAALVLAIVIVPLLYYDALPSQDVLKAFFAPPLEIAAPPPPPPPPAAAARVVKVAPPVVQQPRAFVAPIEVPDQVQPEDSLDLGGVEGGAVGGVEGGVPGGVVGGVVGGLPTALPPPPAQVVRIGGQLKPPRIIRKVDPAFPDLAVAARINAIVVIEAEVDTHGYVKTTKVLSGHPLFDDAALEAVRQWRYQPLLLNGEPTPFVLSVTVSFGLTR
jgi:protein TonB